MKRVLVVGGAGYIGSHTCKALARAGFEPVTLDNMSKGHRWAVRWGPLETCDILDADGLDGVMARCRPDAVVHFAALAYVGESVTHPADYYRTNVVGSYNLLTAMVRHGARRLVFSSTCAVYGVPEILPISERAPPAPVNPYGHTKLAVERMIADFGAAYGLAGVALRYFNACGADPDGDIGEWHDPEPHLIPRALMAANGEISKLDIFGTDFPTADGTCVRDYIHVADLADAHVRALRYLDRPERVAALNLGTGRGYSVRDIIAAVERRSGRSLPVQVAPRRPGDPPSLVADGSLAANLLGFRPAHSDLETILDTAWRWYIEGHRRVAASQAAEAN